MNRRTLLVAGGIIAIGLLVLRRRARRSGVQIEIEDIGTRDRSSPDDVDSLDLERIDGIGPAYADRLREAGVTDVSELVAVDSDSLARESGIAEGRIRSWIEQGRAIDDG